VSEEHRATTPSGGPTGEAAIRVLVVEDSRFMREVIGECLARAPGMRLAGYAENGLAALSQTLRLRPDVVTLDVDLPYLNGLDSLVRIMERKPTPVLILSSFAVKGSPVTLEALERGAVDFMYKPRKMEDREVPPFSRILAQKIRAVASANMDSHRRAREILLRGPQMVGPPSIEEVRTPLGRDGVVVVGASTGGPLALRWILSQLPGDFPLPIVVVQHLPSGYDRQLCERLDGAGPLSVVIPQDGRPLRAGTVYLAPTGRHVVIRGNRRGLHLDLHEGSGVGDYVPSIDVLFRSAIEAAGGMVLGILLTGMGTDGVQGLAAIARAGGVTLAQDESTSTVFGMPREAAACGAAGFVLPLDGIPAFLTAHARRTPSPNTGEPPRDSLCSSGAEST
jgi:two-component system chemotaxis response regulator CheB